MTPQIDIRRATDRAVTRTGWLDSRHSFSFGGHHDPDNVRHGLLLVNNDDRVRAGSGFQTHPHRDMEITWVLSGELEHKDTLGNTGVIYPGLAQRMSAGRGIWHSEINPSPDAEVHFVQMWVLPDTESIDPGYEQLDVNAELDRGGLVTVASGGDSASAIRLRQRSASFHAGRLRAGEMVRIPEGRFLHVFVPAGSATLGDAGLLDAGDAARLTDAGAPELVAGPGGADLMVWRAG